MKEKQLLRSKMKSILHTINKPTYEEWCTEIEGNLFALAEWKHAKTIGITISSEWEVNTTRIIEQAWREGKNVCVPKCHHTTKTMSFHQITSFEQLEVVYFGLREPIESMTKPIDMENIEIMFVPGLCFMKKGYRLGYGGGYYDRYLQTYKGLTISLAFTCQLIDSLPIESFDKPVDKIVLNNEVIVCDQS